MRIEPLVIDGPAGALAPGPRGRPARSLHLLGLGVRHCNFRRVGASDGVYDAGDGETEDLTAAVAHLRAAGNERIWFAGSSLGAWISARMARRSHAEALIRVAPPVQRSDFTEPDVPRCPWLIVQGGY